MLTEHNDYRSYLKKSLAEKISRNPSYSLRAFARQLGIHHSMLSAVFKNEKKISRDRAPLIADKLGLENEDKEYFCLLVELDQTKGIEQKSRILAQLSSFRKSTPVYDLTVDHFKLISDWYHLPILQMVGEPYFKFDSKVISEKIGIHFIEVEAAIERLERLELIEKDKNGNFKKVKNGLLVESPVRSESLRKFHKQMMEKALLSLETQLPKERLIQTQTISFDQTQINEVEDLMDQFFERVVQLSRKGQKRDQIYHLSTVFFNLTDHKNTDQKGKQYP
jgi:uncharacterized protein (TIGR02147 family)